jgi:hypothetical protein
MPGTLSTARRGQKWDEASALIQGAAARLASGDAGGAMTQIRNALQDLYFKY